MDVDPDRWERVVAGLEHLHGSSFHPLPLLADAGVVLAALALAGAPAHLAFAGLGLVPVGALLGLYRRRSPLQSQGVAWYARVLLAPTVAAATLAAVLSPARGPSSEVLVVLAVATTLFAVRVAAWLALASLRRRGHGLRPTLVSGPATAVEQVLRRLAAFPECGLRTASVHIPVDQREKRDPGRQVGPPPGRAHKRALDLIDRRAVDTVLLVSAGGDRGTYDELVHRGEGSGIDYGLVVPLGALGGRRFHARIADLGIVPLGQVNYSTRPMPGKRLFDIVASAALLLALSPVLAAAALAVALADRGPVFYGQQRVGRDGRLFTMWKFRSMVADADRLVDHYRDANVNNGLLFKLQDDPRITRVGAVLRRLSIDELPQLFNVLRGDMSLVGPRPLPVDPDAFDEVAGKRHSVRPGITGPWQVHGGHALNYEDMVSLDLAYISGWSFRRDLWFLALTIPALAVRRAPVL